MNINLADSVVILDEAHNIEDVCRSCGTKDFDLDDLQFTVQELANMIANRVKLELHTPLYHVLNKFLQCASEQFDLLRPHQFDNESNVWHGARLLQLLHSFGLHRDSFEGLKNALMQLGADEQKAIRTEKEELKLNGKALAVLESFLTVAELVLDPLSVSSNNAEHYRFILYNAVEWRQGNHGRPGERAHVRKVGFWCLNPAVTFRFLSSAAQSVILTSGTLSPMESFAGELGVPFDVRLEANHVIDKSQLFVACLPRSEKGLVGLWPA